MATMTAEKTTLYCTEGGSNKQYTVWLERSGGGWLVNFQYGPVGGWVQGGTKTAKPVARAEAEKVYESLLKQKRAKGYAEGADAPVFSQPKPRAAAVVAVEKEEDAGMRPMLLTWAEEGDLEQLIKDDGWGAQEKINGKRIMLKVTPDGVVGSNKRGLECPIPAAVAREMRGMLGEFDGELVGEIYNVFDMTANSVDFKMERCDFRHEHLVSRLTPQAHIRIVPLVVGAEKKRALVEKLRAGRKEGVVFKMLNAPYEAGRRPNLKRAIAVKVKFYAEMAVEVLRWNDKSSVEVAALDGGRLVSVGNVTVHEKYVGQIAAGTVIRVKYLYATEAKKLYQANLDPTDDGSVVADQVAADPIGRLKFENKE
jgi:bifunctional non-homologous end joining protein LigD